MSDPWKGASPLDPAFRDDPFPALARLREIDPVNETPIGVVRLTRYADCVRLLKEVPTGVRLSDGSRPAMPGVDPEDVRDDFMLSQDPPRHTRLRRLVSRAFTPRAISRLQPRMREITDAALDRVAKQGEMDVIADLALPVPATMICEMLGVPFADRDLFTKWTAEATHNLNRLLSPPDVVERADAAAEALGDYFTNLIARRRKAPGQDLMSDLIRAEEEGDRLSSDELLSQTIGLLIAGFETTIGLIGNGIRNLLLHPGELAKLKARPELIESAVEECLRYEGPIILTGRFLHEDAEFGGKTFPKDTSFWAMLFAANRDPAEFTDPDRFDIERRESAHLAFGGGTHFCLGAHLARLEAQTAIGQFAQRFAGLQLESDTVEWGPSLFRVPGRLPVRFRAEA